MNPNNKSRRDFLRQSCVFGAAIYGGSQTDALRAMANGTKRMNILLVIDEDIQNGILGCYNGCKTKTPNIDAFARSSTRFDNAYCQMPECGPSRGAIFSGRRPHETGIEDNKASFAKDAPNVPLIPGVFREHGWQTVKIGKLLHPPDNDSASLWKNLPRPAMSMPKKKEGEWRNFTGGKVPWAWWWAPDCRDEDMPDGNTALAVTNFLNTYRGDQPFFLSVGFARPHDPFTAPRKYFDMYPLESLELPSDQEPADATAPFCINRGLAEALRDKQDQREYLRARYAGISYVDAQFGKIMNCLKANDLLDSTIVIFMGDHGYHHGEHGNHWGKWSLYEDCLKSPFMIHAPCLAGGKGAVCKGAIEFIDLLPTLCDLCGIEPPTGLSGKSLVPLLKNPAARWDHPAFSAWRGGNGRAVRYEKWKYMEWEKGEEGKALFDLENDPGEFYNLATKPEYKDVIKKMRKLLAETYYD